MEPSQSYVICCVQRTGSWLLAHTLRDTGYAGRPSDYLDEEERKTRSQEWGLPSDDLAVYLPAMREHATTPNGVRIFAPLNLAGEVPVNASSLYAKNLLAFLETMIDKKDKTLKVNWDDEIVKGTLVAKDGKIVHPSLQKGT